MRKIGEHVNQLRLMSQMIRNRNKNKEIRIKVGDTMTESHDLDVVKKLHPRLLMLSNRMTWNT
jgi:hypothetical protein